MSRVAGHALQGEGAAFDHRGRAIRWGTSGSGYGLCECGEKSAWLPTAGGRKAWHRDHKARNQQDEQLRRELAKSPAVRAVQWAPSGNMLDGIPSEVLRLLATADGKTFGYGGGPGTTMSFGTAHGDINVAPGQWVVVREDGTITIEDEEPYIARPHRWECTVCDETGILEKDADLFDNAALRHASTHARGIFDEIPKTRLIELEVDTVDG